MIDFGLVDAVDAEAIGEPGARTFRVRARVGTNLAALWMEKEQLAAMGRSISALLAERASGTPHGEAQLAAVEEFGNYPDVELQVVRMGLDYNAEAQRMVVLADDAEALQSGNTPAFRMEIERQHAAVLIPHIGGIVSAGRPLCPLCGRPLEGDGEHFCPESNGHSRDLPLPAQGGDEQ